MPKQVMLLSLGFILWLPVSVPAQADSSMLAATPPMGWNSWDGYGTTIKEAEVKANAQWFAEHLKPYGWQHVVVDMEWYVANPTAEGNSKTSSYSVDGYGRYTPAQNRFPSAAKEAGFKPLADYLHSLGLKFGIHILRGIPKQAVAQNLPIEGSAYHAADAADTTDTCPWNFDNYGVDATKPAGQAYYDSILRLYASWDVDFIKVDCIASRPYKGDEIRMLAAALKKTGRPIALSLSPGAAPLEKTDEMKKYAQMWRISDDIWDLWHSTVPYPQGLGDQFANAAKWAGHSEPGHWADADMLPLGRLGPAPGWGQPRDTRLTHEEQRTFVTLWVMFPSPLMVGGDLTAADAWTTSLLTNPEVLTVDQTSTGNHPVITTDKTILWLAKASEMDRHYVAVFNLQDSSQTIEYSWKEVGLNSTHYSLRDLWEHKDLGVAGSLKVTLPPHGTVLYRISEVAFAQSSTAPTSSVDPVVIDEAWQKASAKFDSKRESILQEVNKAAHSGPFRPQWQSLDQYEVPEWYKDAKFGIFIHWGLYSVPAFANEWYPRNMYIEGSEEYKHHLMTYGSPDKFGYKDFIPLFKAEHFDPGAWARLFKEAGAKYVVPVFEHHDGFAMYDCGLSDWTAAKMGPHRDLVGDLAKAVRAEGLRLGASSHRVEHNFFLGVGRNITSDINDPKYAAFYGPAHTRIENLNGTPLANDFTFVSEAWTHDWLARSAEIVQKYHPDVMYFDWWIGQASVREDLTRFAAYYYNSSLQYGDHVGVIDYKDFAMPEHAAVLDMERGQLSAIRPLYWQTDTSISNGSWGYVEHDTFKSPEFIVRQLIDIVSKNGNLLLNIGPRSDGTIPDEVQQVLLDVGGWLKINGEAIYGTRAWKVNGEGPTQVAAGSFHDTETKPYTSEDFRFTRKGNVIYAMELGWPAMPSAVIHSLATASDAKVESVTLLGSGASIPFQQQPDGLHLQLPERPKGNYAYTFRIVVASSAPAPSK